MISRSRPTPQARVLPARPPVLVAEARQALALGAALGFALLLAVALALAPLLVLVVTGDDANALAEGAVLSVRGELRAARPIVAAWAAAGSAGRRDGVRRPPSLRWERSASGGRGSCALTSRTGVAASRTQALKTGSPGLRPSAAWAQTAAHFSGWPFSSCLGLSASLIVSAPPTRSIAAVTRAGDVGERSPLESGSCSAAGAAAPVASATGSAAVAAGSSGAAAAGASVGSAAAVSATGAVDSCSAAATGADSTAGASGVGSAAVASLAGSAAAAAAGAGAAPPRRRSVRAEKNARRWRSDADGRRRRLRVGSVALTAGSGLGSAATPRIFGPTAGRSVSGLTASGGAGASASGAGASGAGVASAPQRRAPRQRAVLRPQRRAPQRRASLRPQRRAPQRRASLDLARAPRQQAPRAPPARPRAARRRAARRRASVTVSGVADVADSVSPTAAWPLTCDADADGSAASATSAVSLVPVG